MRDNNLTRHTVWGRQAWRDCHVWRCFGDRGRGGVGAMSRRGLTKTRLSAVICLTKPACHWRVVCWLEAGTSVTNTYVSLVKSTD